MYKFLKIKEFSIGEKTNGKAGHMLLEETKARELEIEKAKGTPLKKEADRFEDLVGHAEGSASTKGTQQS